MEFYDTGIVLAHKDFAENQKILSVITEKHGLWRGLVWKSVNANIGDYISFSWKSRTLNGLGRFSLDTINITPVLLLFDKKKLLMIKSISEMCCKLLPERDFCDLMFYFIKNNIGNIDYKTYILFEILLLETLGYCLNFEACAVTGEIGNVFYLSPKTGRSVSKIIGDPYKDKLFQIPNFFLHAKDSPTYQELLYGFKITEYFLKKNVSSNQNIYFFRDRIVSGMIDARPDSK